MLDEGPAPMELNGVTREEVGRLTDETRERPAPMDRRPDGDAVGSKPEPLAPEAASRRP